MRTGPRSLILRNGVAFRIGLPSETIVGGSIHEIDTPCSLCDLGKKLKRRLEDLEKRAGSSSASPEESYEEPETPRTVQATKTRTRHRPSRSTSDVDCHTSVEQLSPFDYYNGQDDRGSMFSHQCTRQLSASPPPVFFPSYSQLDSYGHSVYGHSPSYNSFPGSHHDMTFAGDYEEPLPSIGPVATSAGRPMKRVHQYPEDDMMSPFSMSYAAMAGIDLCSAPQPMSSLSVRSHVQKANETKLT